MHLDEAEREIFDQLTQEYIDEFGIKPLIAVYRLHRNYSSKICNKNFPVVEIRNFILFQQMKAAGIVKVKDVKQFLKENGFGKIQTLAAFIEDYKSFLRHHKRIIKASES
jgi:hypothetical protein